MPGDEMSSTASEGEEKGRMKKPLPSALTHFSELSLCHFGISSHSFVPTPSNSKDNPAKVKARRRRSTIGVRGSPETNTLIRFMAQQRMRTPPAPASSSLRQKIASFQSLMDLEEKEVYEPKQEEWTTDGSSKENLPPSETPSVDTSPVGPDLKEMEVFSLQTTVPPPHREPVSVLLSPHPPPVLWIRSSGDEDSSGTMSPVRKKKKKVHFGGLLSPELFDKNLPPSTPLQKGGTPVRALTPGRGLMLQSVLKKSGRSGTPTTFGRLDVSVLTEISASPPLTQPHRSRVTFDDDGAKTNVEEDEEIVLPSTKEIFAAISGEAEYLDFQPSNVTSTSGEEASSQAETDSDVITSSGTQEAAAPATTSGRNTTDDSVRRSTRSSAKAACGKMKKSSAGSCRWSRGVDRSLYGSREFASKNPTLSPITERRSSGAAVSSETDLKAQMSCIIEEPSPPAVIQTWDPCVPPPKAAKKRRVEALDSGVLSEELSEDQKSSQQSPHQQTLVDGAHRDRTSDLEPPKGSEPLHSPPLTGNEAEQKAEQDWRGSSDQPPGKRRRCDEEEEEVQTRDLSGSSSSSGFDPAHSQVDFNFEDIFKPVATRRQRSVRRSLRNQSSVTSDQSVSGLAWMPWTPTESSRSFRRKSSRRVRDSLSNQTTASEERQEAV